MSTMRAMVFETVGAPLRSHERPLPSPGPGQVRIRVRSCGVCRTDLHVVDGELTRPKLPLILGHEIVGIVDVRGEAVSSPREGERVGVPWLGWTCNRCSFCLAGRENLCAEARFTGYTLDGGYAEYALADARYCFPIPEGYDDLHAAPLLCAGLIGYRSYRMAPDAEHLGIYGFGAAAHILAQIAVTDGRRIYAFTRPGDQQAQAFAHRLGATWAGDSDQSPPRSLDAAILFAPVGELVPRALQAVRRGGTVVCGGIHMSDIPSFPYRLLWEERTLRSVAHLTRSDAMDFMRTARRVRLQTEVQCYALGEANDALDQLRAGRVRGAAVLGMD